MAIIVQGREIARGIIASLAAVPRKRRFFALFMCGVDAATGSFVAQKRKAAQELGIDFRTYELDPAWSIDKARAFVGRIARSSRCGGAVIQLPLSGNLRLAPLANAIPANKDVDVLSARASGGFYAGSWPIMPPSVGALAHILAAHGYEPGSFSRAAVIGQGILVGRPISAWLAGKVANVLALDKGFDPSIIGTADLVVCGAGAAGLIAPSQVREGAVVVDFGYGTDPATGKPSGDFATSRESCGHLALYTPTPGGTGPVLVASLFENFIALNRATQ
jgi:5,10-methylene-tetrahydrofolate dehydrogenase/methenyl tetrahydrofolate cyclohydrolase